MTWTNMSFPFGSVLTSTKMTQLSDNVTALANGDSGAPRIQHNALQNPPGMELLGKISYASSRAHIDISGFFTSSFDLYKIIVYDTYINSQSSALLTCHAQVSHNSLSNVYSGARYHYKTVSDLSSFYSSPSISHASSQNSIRVFGGSVLTTQHSGGGMFKSEIDIVMPLGSVHQRIISSRTSMVYSSTNGLKMSEQYHMGVCNISSYFNSIRIIPAASLPGGVGFARQKAMVYGIRTNSY